MGIMSKFSVFRCVAFFVVIWWVQVFYVLLPPVFSFGRVFREYRFYASFLLTAFTTFFVDDRKLDYSSVHSIAFDSMPQSDTPVEFMKYTRETFSFEQARIDTRNFDMPFIVKGFATDLLEKFDYDYVMETFVDDDFDFEVGALSDHNYTNGFKAAYLHTTFPFKEGMTKMKETDGDLYLRASMTLHQQNPEFGDALMKAMERVGPGWTQHVGNAETAIKTCFIGMGNRSKTIQHADIAENWFLQVSGVKRWVIAAPNYTPYWKPVFSRAVALGSLLPLYNESMGIPTWEVESHAGDLFFFPGWWWHEANNEDFFNFGCGYRPIETIYHMMQSLAVPVLTYPTGSLGLNLCMWPQTLNVLRKHLRLKFTWDWKEMFSPKSLQKWWVREGEKQDYGRKKKEL